MQPYLVDLHTNLSSDLSLTPDGQRVQYSYNVNATGVPPAGGVPVQFLWATGPNRSNALPGVPPALTRTLTGPDATLGRHTKTLTWTELGTRPAGATHLVMVLDPDNAIIEYSETNNVAAVVLPATADLRADSLAWNATQGGAVFTVGVNGTLPPSQTIDVRFHWSSTSALSGSLSSFNVVLSAGTTTSSVTADRLGTPPAGAQFLLMQVDPFNRITESNESELSNVKPLAYAPAIELVSVTHDGDNRSDWIGRFISGVDVSGQAAEFRLSESLAALRPQVQVQLGGQTRTASPKGADGRTYSLDFNPGAFEEGEVKMTPAAVLGSTELKKGSDTTIDVVRLADWIDVLTSKDIGFDPATGQYVIKGKWLNVQVGELFKIDSGVWFGGLLPSFGSLDAGVEVTVVAGLNPMAEPTVSGTVDVNLVWFGTPIYSKSFTSTGGGPFTATVNLEGRTLEIESAKFQYKESNVSLPGAGTISLFGGEEFTTTWYKATSAVTFTPRLTTDISLTLDTQGRLAAGSYADVELSGQLGGTLVDFGSNVFQWARPSVLHALRAANLPGLVIQRVLGALLPIDIVAEFLLSGDLRLKGHAVLSDSGSVATTFSGAFEMNVSGKVYVNVPFLGKKYELFSLPSAIDEGFSIDEEWPS
jgi:hypothetical protein